jgi:phosphohistidine swiveling domain-containing protein
MCIQTPHTLDEKKVGMKAIRLAELTAAGHRVPAFVVLSGETLETFFNTEQDAQRVVREIQIALPESMYAVRSAALTEDGDAQSMAGKFQSILLVTPEDLQNAIRTVCLDAREKLGSLQYFSIIVQECIEPDVAGVLFTRDPNGGGNAVIEYTKGFGDTVVGGEGAKRVDVYTGEAACNLFVGCDTLIHIGRTIEQQYDFPQDIEWAVKNGKVFILQTRPITSLSQEQWKGFCAIDASKLQAPYYYTQGDFTENFSQTTPLSYSLLQHIYREGGSVQRAYEAIDVQYTAREHIRRIGNTVYIDKQKEAHLLYPAFGYYKKKSAQLHIERFSGLWTSLRNEAIRARLDSTELQHTLEKVQELLLSELDDQASLQERLAVFDEWYQVIFTANMYAPLLLPKAVKELGAQKQMLGEIMRCVPYPDVALFPNVQKLLGKDVGNSISLDDYSLFVTASTEGDVCAWQAAFPVKKAQQLEHTMQSLQQSVLVRELGRWATVCIMNYVRSGVPAEASAYMSLQEIVQGNIGMDILANRTDEFAYYTDVVFPETIASFTNTLVPATGNVGVSPGTATGILVSVSAVDAVAGAKILHITSLSPDIAPLLHREDVIGVVTQRGNLLSHMAIIAREQKVPVVITTDTYAVGTSVSIDGASGVVTSVDTVQ